VRRVANKAIGNLVHAGLELFELLLLKACSHDPQAVTDPAPSRLLRLPLAMARIVLPRATMTWLSLA
jgi:hypothetical protein